MRYDPLAALGLGKGYFVAVRGNNIFGFFSVKNFPSGND